jgi:cation diffusion facilitator family transporter
VVRRVGAIVLGVNLVLVAAKGVVWIETGSLAVGSETINSLADSLYSLVVVAGLYLTTRPPDFDHPHGHERIEPFVALFIAFGIFAAGAFVVWQAGTTIIAGEAVVSIGLSAVGVLVASAAVKFGLYRYCLRVGEEHQSPATIAMGLDSRIDVLTASAALIGVLGVRVGFPLLDPVAAVAVSIGIFYTGWEVVRDNIHYLIGSAPPAALREEILQRALAHPDVKGAHDVVAHHVGPQVDVSLHIEVEGDRTLLEAHEIESAVAASIRELAQIDDVFVHVDPRELGEWKEDENVDRLLQSRSGADNADE